MATTARLSNTNTSTAARSSFATSKRRTTYSGATRRRPERTSDRTKKSMESRTPIYTSSEESLDIVDEQDEPLNSSFLMYCTSCEKQIDAPTYSKLYCSESCRRRDSNASLPVPVFQNDSYFPYTPPESPMRPDFSRKDSMPLPRFELRRPSMNRHSVPEPLHLKSFNPDNLHLNARSIGRPGNGRSESESRFTPSSLKSPGRTQSPRRPRFNRAITTTSLSAPQSPHRPVTPPIERLSLDEEANGSPSRRLPPRTRPGWSRAISSKSIDLVTPMGISGVPSTPTSPSLSCDAYVLSPGLDSASLKSGVSLGRLSEETVRGQPVFYNRSDLFPGDLQPGRHCLRKLFEQDQAKPKSWERKARPITPRWNSTSGLLSSPMK